MNNFKEFLTEGRFAPLYHGTSFNKCLKIIKGDKINGNTKHSNILRNNSYTTGVSLSRSLRFSMAWCFSEVVLQFDQIKLNQKYKMIPFNPQGAYGFSKASRYHPDSMSGLNNTNPFDFPHGSENQMEEFVIGDITNLKRYCTQIIFANSYLLDSFLKETEDEYWKNKAVLYGKHK